MVGRTEIRMQKIRSRSRQYRRRHEKRVRSTLSLFTLALLLEIAALLQQVHSGGVSMVADGYGTVLLREGTGAYVVVGIAAFALGVALTVFCIQYKKKNSNRRSSAEEGENQQ